jgi:hypothetical protein
MVKKFETLRKLDIGNPVAEEEREALNKYFVETEFWRKVYAGDVDIVYGSKGAGKSAIYLLLNEKIKELNKKGFILVNAENARGTPAFNEVASDPPTSEENFKRLWKLYFLALAAKTIVEEGLADSKIKHIAELLIEVGIDEKSPSRLKAILASVREYVERFTRIKSVEGGIAVEPNTGTPTVTGKITFLEPTQEQRKQDIRSVDSYLNDIDDFLKSIGKRIWILIDRLDVAFADTPDLEKNAIRALFRVYGDLRSMDNLNLKIFIRTDIWDKITSEGFREASHVTKEISISWDQSSILNLITKRFVSNDSILEVYNVDRDGVLGSTAEQEALFGRIFPEKVEAGSRRPKTLTWLLSRTVDGSGKHAPREVVALLGHLIQKQIERYERGDPEPEGEALFEGATFKLALPALSQERLTKTLYAEYPAEKQGIEALRRGKAEQTLATLCGNWNLPEEEAEKKAQRLVEVGFFERRGAREQPTYWVPFIYRPALELIQGRAED